MQDSGGSGSSSAPDEKEYFDVPYHEPTIGDIRLVRFMLQQVKHLPPELVDQILDHAEYWLHSEVSVDYQDDPLLINGTQVGEEDRLIVRLPFVDTPERF
jgi:hypothetical protein